MWAVGALTTCMPARETTVEMGPSSMATARHYYERETERRARAVGTVSA